MMLPAEELRTDLRRGMARLEHYLDRAAAERKARSWEQLAQSGLEAAMYEWESGALWLQEQDAEAWQEERERAQTSYRKEIESAYVRWASERVYRERAGFDSSGLGAALREAAGQWSYGDSGRTVIPAEAGAARAAWERAAGEIIDRYLEGWEERQGAVYAELEDRFRDLGLDDGERGALIREAAEGRRAELAREYSRIALAEGNRLMAELLYDQGSVKKLAASEAAGVIARELAREVEAAAAERTRELFGKLDTMIAAEQEGGIELNAKDWLNQFRGAFEEALARWEEAELGFLAARAEWEHDAEDAYLAGEESWNKAYLELAERQKAWETALLQKLDEGFAKWHENESRLVAEIETAREEFLAASEESRKVKEKLLDSQGTIYIRSRQMLDLARQGIESWFSLWDQKYLTVYTYIKNAAAAEEKARAEAGETEGETGETTGGENNNDSEPTVILLAELYKELDYEIFNKLLTSLDFDDLINPYLDYGRNLRAQIELLQEAYLTTLERNMGRAPDQEFLESVDTMLNEKTGWLSLADRYRDYADNSAKRLYEMAGSLGENHEGFSGELRTELLKANALLRYWDAEFEVADALNRYAQETSSAIEDAGRTRAELEKARAAYDESVKNYERIAELVNDKALLLDAARDNFVKAQAALAERKAAMEEAQRDYSNVLAAIQQSNPAPVYAELTELAKALLDSWKEKSGTPGQGNDLGILEYYRLSQEYADILRSLEIGGIVNALTTGSGLGQSGIAGLEAKAEEARLISQAEREEDLRAAAGLYPAGLSVFFRPGLGAGEEALAQDGRELLISLDQAYRESVNPQERETLLELMRQIWIAAAAYYEGEVLLRNESIAYLTTETSLEIGEEAKTETEIRVYLRGLLAALRLTARLELSAGEGNAAGEGQAPPENGSGMADLAALVEHILSADGGSIAEAVQEAGSEIPLFAAALEGDLALSGPARVAAWLAQREAARELGLDALERNRLIQDRYGSYYGPAQNQKNQDARQRVETLIAALRDGTTDTRGKDKALEYAAELRNAGAGLSPTGQEALESYIAAFLEYAAVRDYEGRLGSGVDIQTLEEEYTRITESYRVYDSWQYKIYDPAELAAIRESAEFGELPEAWRETFAAGDLAALSGWVTALMEITWTKLVSAFDVLVYAQYYKKESEGSRFAWLPGMAALKNSMLDSGVTEQMINSIEPLFTGDAVNLALEDLKGKALLVGSWFLDDSEWGFTQYREGLDAAKAESARLALEQAYREYQSAMSLDAQLSAALTQSLDKLRYLNESADTLKILKDVKFAVMMAALTDYDSYANGDYSSAVKAMDRSCEDYNTAVDQADEAYRGMEAARLLLRTRQEITDWAESVYLKNFGTNYEENYITPQEKLSHVQYARERAQVAVTVLNEMLGARDSGVDARYSDAMETYKESRRAYYLAQVAAYEGERAIARQEALIREAELAEQAARGKLVKASNSAEPGPYELVNLVDDGNGGYRLELAYTLEDRNETIQIASHDPDRPVSYVLYLGKQAVKKPVAAIDKAAFERYFGDETAVALERLGSPKTMTMAEWEAGEWLEAIGRKGSAYFDDVMLASLYIKYCAAAGSPEGEAWFTYDSDPRSGGNYTMGDIPLGTAFPGLDLEAEYNSARRDVLREAYNRVMGGGGEEDIARYLLYRGRNLITGSPSYEEDLLKSLAFEKVDRAAGETHRNYTIAFGIAMGLGAALAAAAAAYSATVLFNPGNVFLAVQALEAAAVIFAAAGVLGYARDQINNLWGAVQRIQRDTDAVVGRRDSQFQNEYSAWLESAARLKSEREVLNRMLYGAAEKPAAEGEESPPLAYENFRNGLEALLKAGGTKTAVTFEEAIVLYGRALYEESGAREGSSVIGAIKILNSALEQKAGGRKTALEQEAERLKSEQEKTIGLYNETMASAMPIPKDRQAELRALALRAGDPSLSIAERRAASLEYERLIAELSAGAADTGEAIRALLRKAFGDNTWNSGYHSASLVGLEGELFGGRVLYNRPAEFYTEGEVQLLRESALATLDVDTALKLSVHEREWDLKVEDFLNQYGAWQEQVEQIRQTGLSQWEKARAALNEGYNNWRKNFGNEYQAKTEAWDLNYFDFVNQKQSWVEDQYLYAVYGGNPELFEYSGGDPSQAAGQALARLSVERMNRESVDPAAYTAALLEDSILGELLGRINKLGARAETGGLRVKTATRRTSAAESLAQSAKLIGEMDREIQQSAAKLAAQEAQRLIAELIRGLQGRLDNENRALWEWEERLLQLNGYQTDGEIRRTVVVDTTLFESITRTQTVHRYQYFDPGKPDPGVDLNKTALENYDADTIMRIIAAAKGNLDQWGEMIFGRVENNRPAEHRVFRGLGDGQDADAYAVLRDGKLGAHIGYGPVLKDKVDYRHSPLEDAVDPGMGEMGRILLDFMWNSQVSSMGYLEAGKALYDQKIWAGEFIPGLSDLGLTIQAPTMRDTLSLAAGIGGIAHPLVSFADDVFFAALDLGIGYRSPDEVMKSVAISAASSVVSYGAAALGNIDGLRSAADALAEPMAGIFGDETAAMLVQAMGTAAASYTGGAAVNALQAYDFRTGNFDYAAYAQSLYSTETIAGALSAFVGAGLGGLAGKAMTLADQKLYGGLVNLAVAGYSEAARYGVYALDSMATGSGDVMKRLGEAYGSMGGITLNLANLGSMLDLAGTLSYRLNENYHTNLGTLGGQFAGTGLVELNLGLHGASLSLGMGGVDVAGNLYNSAKHGLDYAVLANSGGASGDRDLLLAHYLNGDWAAENTSMRIGAGMDQLVIADPGQLGSNTFGYTARQKDGSGRVITIADMGDTNANAILLQHESHRDGYAAGNTMETVAAVLAHTQMVGRMLRDNVDFAANEVLLNDLLAYYDGGGMAAFARYALENYESGGDYWRVYQDEEGNVTKVLYDGEYNRATIVEADGTETTVEFEVGNSLSGALANVVGNGMTKKAMNDIMVASGLDYNPESRTWYAVDERGVYVPPAQMQTNIPELAPEALSSTSDQRVESGILQKAGALASHIWQSTRDGFKNAANFLGDLFGNGTKPVQPEGLTGRENTIDSIGGPGNPVMDNSAAEKVQEQTVTNTFSVKDSKGNDVEIFAMDARNPALSGLLSQHDDRLKSIPAISDAGCNFMVALGYAQLAAGRNLTATQYLEIWEEAVRSPEILKDDGLLNDPDKLAAIALKTLGRVDIGLSFGWKAAGSNSTLIGYRIQIPYKKDSHFILSDTSGNILYNPGNTDQGPKTLLEVYVYGK
jgi:hypothetical protein